MISYVITYLRCLQQPQIILLKEGTDTSQGKAQLISNINACVAVVDAVRTTLGPRGMDKLIHTDRVTFSLQSTAEMTLHCTCHLSFAETSLTLQGVTISNDGATIMKLLEIIHPAAKTLVDISLSQDAEVMWLGVLS